MRTHLLLLRALSLPLPAVFQVPHSVFGRPALLRMRIHASRDHCWPVRTDARATTHHSASHLALASQALIITGLTILRLGQVFGRRNATAKGRNDYSQRQVFGDIDAQKLDDHLDPHKQQNKPHCRLQVF